MSLLKTERRRVQFKTKGPTLTKQAMRDACDINRIMKRYQKTGLIEHVKQGGTYGDFTDVKSYHEAMNQVLAANEAFMTLAAELRARFNNDPSKMIEFLTDPANIKEAEELGLIEKKKRPVSPIQENAPGNANTTINDENAKPDAK